VSCRAGKPKSRSEVRGPSSDGTAGASWLLVLGCGLWHNPQSGFPARRILILSPKLIGDLVREHNTMLFALGLLICELVYLRWSGGLIYSECCQFVVVLFPCHCGYRLGFPWLGIVSQEQVQTSKHPNNGPDKRVASRILLFAFSFSPGALVRILDQRTPTPWAVQPRSHPPLFWLAQIHASYRCVHRALFWRSTKLLRLTPYIH